jgi:hypothetical protein
MTLRPGDVHCLFERGSGGEALFTTNLLSCSRLAAKRTP